MSDNDTPTNGHTDTATINLIEEVVEAVSKLPDPPTPAHRKCERCHINLAWFQLWSNRRYVRSCADCLGPEEKADIDRCREEAERQRLAGMEEVEGEAI